MQRYNFFRKPKAKKMQGRQNDDPAAIKTNKKKPIINVIMYRQIAKTCTPCDFFFQIGDTLSPSD
jgi:hypothetical protein